MTDTRLTTDEVELLRTRLPVGFHIDEELLRKAATEYLRLNHTATCHRLPGLHYSMTMLRDWLTRRLEDWPREDQDDMDADLLRRLFALDSAWSADCVSQARIIALIETQREANDT